MSVESRIWGDVVGPAKLKIEADIVPQSRHQVWDEVWDRIHAQTWVQIRGHIWGEIHDR